jgi:Predicted aminopeptidases
MNYRTIFIALCLVVGIAGKAAAQTTTEPDVTTKVLHNVSDSELREWLGYFVSEECRGRLTGDIGFDRAANYAANLFEEWGLEPLGDNGTYFQKFDHPYVEVKHGGSFTLHIPVGKDWVEKTYDYPENYMAGGTSDNGELNKLDLVYVGYGITAPELGYDDYKGIDVRGKIVVCERDIPYQGREPELQKAWMPYQYHSFKMSNAVKHGAAGMLYVTVTANPNPGWNKDFIYACISENVAKDIFAGTGKNHKETVEKMQKTLKPQSFPISKKADIKAVTEYHPDGIGYNIIGMIRGTDPTLEAEVIMAGGHLDHVGMMPVLIPGALDNASGSVIVMGAAKALATSGFKPKRTCIFILYGAEETGLIGSQFFVDNPKVPLENIKTLFNIDMLGNGYGLVAGAAQKFGTSLDYVEKANSEFVKRAFRTRLEANEIITRPRTDGAVFFRAGVPVISLNAFGATGNHPYHHPGDVKELINFDIVRDAVKLLSTTMMELSTEETLNISAK